MMYFQVARTLTAGTKFLKPSVMRDTMVQMVLWQAPLCTVL